MLSLARDKECPYRVLKCDACIQGSLETAHRFRWLDRQGDIVRSYKDDYAPWDELIIDGKERYNSRPFCECPEDAILGRALIGADEIADLMKKAYECGQSGDLLEIEYEAA